MIWVDAQLSPALALWLRETLGLDASALREIGLRDAEDDEIFAAARKDRAILMTKDSDFVLLLERFGPPPKIILLTCGNTSNAHLKIILGSTLTKALELLDSGDAIVEIQ